MAKHYCGPVPNEVIHGQKNAIDTRGVVLGQGFELIECHRIPIPQGAQAIAAQCGQMGTTTQSAPNLLGNHSNISALRTAKLNLDPSPVEINKGNAVDLD